MIYKLGGGRGGGGGGWNLVKRRGRDLQAKEWGSDLQARGRGDLQARGRVKEGVGEGVGGGMW